MEIDRWSKIIVRWINCLTIPNVKISCLRDLLDVQTLYHLISYLESLDAGNTCLSQELCKESILTFLKREYPSFTNEGTLQDHGEEEVLTVASLLLHYSCIKTKDGVVRGAMCSKLNQADQKVIMLFANSLMKCEAITEGNLKEVILGLTYEGYQESPNQCSSNAVSPSTPCGRRSKKSRCIMQLEAALETERFDRNYLQDELKRVNAKIVDLEKQHVSDQSDLSAMRQELESARLQFEGSDGTPGKLGPGNKAEERLRGEVTSLEGELLQKMGEVANLTEERDTLSKKNADIERELTKWKTQAVVSENLKESLQCQLEDGKGQISSLKLSLVEAYRVLEEYRQEHLMNVSIECDDDSVSQKREFNSPYKGSIENLGKAVIDIQLKEQINQNNLLSCQLEELQRDKRSIDEEVERLTKNLNHVQAELTSVSDINTQIQTQVRCLEECKIKLLDEIKTANETVNCLEEKLHHQNENISKLSGELHEKTLEIKKMSGEKISLDERIKTMECEVTLHKKNIETHLSRVQELTSHVTSLANENSILTQNLKESKETFEAAIVTLTEEHKQMENKLAAELELCQNDRTEKVRDFEQAKRDLEAKLFEQTDMVRRLDEDLERKNIDMEHLSTEKNDLEKRAIQLECNIESHLNCIKELRENIEEIKAEKAMLTKDLVKIKEESIKKEKELLEKYKQKEEKMVLELDTCRNELENKIKTANEENNSLLDCLNNKNNIISNLTEELKIKNNELDIRNSENDNLCAQIRSMENSVATYEREIESHLSSIRELTVNIANMERDKCDLIKAFEEFTEKSKSMIRSLNEECKRKDEQLVEELNVCKSEFLEEIKNYNEETVSLKTMVNELNADLDKKNKENDELNTNLDEKNKENEELDANLDKKNKDIAELNANLDTKNKENEKLNANLNEKNKENEELKANLDTKNKKNEELNANLDIKNKDNIELNVNLDKKNKENAELNANLDTKNKENEKLNANLNEKNKENEELKANLDTKNKENEELTANLDIKNKENAELNANLDTKNKENEDLYAVKENLTLEVQTFEKDIKLHQSEIKKLTEDLKSKEIAKLNLLRNLEEVKQEFEDTIQLLKSENQKREDHLISDLRDTEQLIRKYEKQCGELHQTISSNTDQINQLSKANNELNIDNECLKRDLLNLSQTLKEIQDENIEFKKEAEHLTVILQSVQNDNNDLKTTNLQLSDALENFKSENNELKTKMELSYQNIDTLTDENNNLKKHNGKLQNEVEKILTSITGEDVTFKNNSENNSVNRINNINQLSNSVQQIVSENDHLKSVVKQISENINTIRDENDTLKVQHTNLMKSKDDMNYEFCELCTVNQALRYEIEEINHEMIGLSNTITLCEDENECLKNSNAQLIEDVSKLKSDNNNLTNDLSQLSDTIKEIQGKNIAMAESVKQFFSISNVTLDGDLNESLKYIMESWQQQKVQNDDLNNNIKLLSESVVRLEENNDELKKSNMFLLDENNNLKNTNSQLSNDISIIQENYNVLQTKNQELSNSVNSFEVQKTELTHTNKKLSDALMLANNESTDIIDKISNMSQDLHIKIDINKGLKMKVNIILESLKYHQDENCKLKNDVEQLTDFVNNIKEENHDFRNNIQQTLICVQKLEKEKNDLLVKNKDLSDSTVIQLNTHNQLDSTLKILQEENNVFRARNKELLDSVVIAQDENTNLKDKIKLLSEENANLINESEKIINKLEENISSFKTENEGLKADMEKNSELIHTQKRENLDLMNDIESLTSNSNKLQDENITFKRKFDQITDSLIRDEKHITIPDAAMTTSSIVECKNLQNIEKSNSIQTEEIDLVDEFDNLLKSVNSIKIQNYDLKADNVRYRNEIEILQDENDVLKVNATKLSNTVDLMEAKIKNFQSLSDSIQEEKEKYLSLEKNIKQLLENNDKLLVENKELKDYVEKLTQTNNILAVQNKELKDIIEKSTQSNDSLLEQYKEFKDEVEKLAQTNDSLVLQNQELKDDVEKLTQTNDSLVLQNQELKDDVEKVTQTNDFSHLQTKELKDNIEKLTQTNDSLVLRKQELIDDVEKLTETNDSLVLENKELKDDIEKLTETNDSLVLENKELKDDVEKLTQTNYSLVLQNKELKDEVEKSIEIVNKLNIDKTALTETLNFTQNKNTDLENSVAIYQAKTVILKENERTLHKMLYTKTQQLFDSIQKNSEAVLSSKKITVFNDIIGNSKKTLSKAINHLKDVSVILMEGVVPYNIQNIFSNLMNETNNFSEDCEDPVIVECLNNYIDVISKILTFLTEQNGNFKSTLKCLQEENKTLLSDYQNCKVKYESTVSETVCLKQKLTEVELVKEKLEKSLDSSDAITSTTTVKNSTTVMPLHSSLEDFITKLNENEHKITEVFSVYERLTTNFYSVQNSLHKINDYIHECLGDKDAIEKALRLKEEIEREYVSLESQCKVLMPKIISFSSDFCSVVSKNLRQLKGQAQDDNEASSIRDDSFINNISREIDEIEEGSQNIQAVISHLESSIQKIQEINPTMNSKEIQRHLHLENDRENSVYQTLQSFIGKYTLVKNELSHVDMKYKSSVESVKQLQSKNIEICHENNELTNKLSALRKVLKEMEMTNSEHSVIIEEMKFYKEQYDVLSKTEREYKKLMTENVGLKKRIESLNSNMDSVTLKLNLEMDIMKNTYEKLLRDHQEAEARLANGGDTNQLVVDMRNEYEDKLTRMKQKMKQLYQEQIAVYTEKQKEEMSGLEALCKKYMEKIKRYEDHVNELMHEQWTVGERLLIERKENEELRRRLKEHYGSHQSLNSITSTMSLPHTKTEIKKNTLSVRSASVRNEIKKRGMPSPIKEKHPMFKQPLPCKVESGGLHMSDEEGEVFDNTYLQELKVGICEPRASSTAHNSHILSDRLSELQWRNSLCPPHLKSSYPAETQFHKLKEEDIKTGAILVEDSPVVEKPRNKKEVGQTSYHKPGPPTPSKNGGRLSLQGNELREPLREQNDNNPKKATTPSRIKALFMGNTSRTSSRDENTFGTPKSRRLSIFRKQK